jgi:hypothetical protein
MNGCLAPDAGDFLSMDKPTRQLRPMTGTGLQLPPLPTSLGCIPAEAECIFLIENEVSLRIKSFALISPSAPPGRPSSIGRAPRKLVRASAGAKIYQKDSRQKAIDHSAIHVTQEINRQSELRT